MKDYVIVEAFNIDLLAERVKERMQIGYEPTGGVSSVFYIRRWRFEWLFFQAMFFKQER